MLTSLFRLTIPAVVNDHIMLYAKAKNTVLLSVSLASLNAFFVVFSIVMGLPMTIVLACFFGMLAYLAPLIVLRLSRTPLPAGLLMTTGAFSVVVALCFITSESVTQSMPWFMIVPLVAAMTHGRKLSIIAGVASLAVMVGFAAANGILTSAQSFSTFTALFFLIAFATFSVAVLESTKTVVLNSLDEERVRANEEAQRAEVLAATLAEEKALVEQKIADAVAASEAQQQRLAEGVTTMLAAMQELADGNLTTQISVDANDDVGKLYQGFNAVAASFHTMVAEVQDAIHTTANTTAEVNYAAAQIAAAVAEQSAQMSQIATAMDQMFQTVRSNAECAGETLNASVENVHNAQQGKTLMDTTMSKMREIVSIAQESERLVAGLDSSSEEIGEIVSVIHEIADQTNLLALNAAIEAARAGEHGRGFSVVADEVRKLAERTVGATKQIVQTVKDIQTRTKTVMTGIRTSNQNLQQGLNLATEAGSAFEMIVAGDEVIQMKVDEIASATEQQSSSSHQINANIQQISAATEETSVIVSQVSASTDSLSKRMEGLLRLASVFKTDTASIPNLAASHKAAALPQQIDHHTNVHSHILHGQQTGQSSQAHLLHQQRATSYSLASV